MQMQLMNVSGYELENLDPKMTIEQLLQMKRDQHEAEEAEMLVELMEAKSAYAGKYFRMKYSDSHIHYIHVEDVVEGTGFRTRITGTEIRFTKHDGRFEIEEYPMAEYQYIENLDHHSMKEVSEKDFNRMRISSLPIFSKK